MNALNEPAALLLKGPVSKIFMDANLMMHFVFRLLSSGLLLIGGVRFVWKWRNTYFYSKI